MKISLNLTKEEIDGIKIEQRLITIPNRDEQGWLCGVKRVLVEWRCPHCGQVMGEPKLTHFCEEGEFYDVDTWENSCGHICSYKDLRIIEFW